MFRLLIAWLLATLAIHTLVIIDELITGSYRIFWTGLVLISLVSPAFLYVMAPSRSSRKTSEERLHRSGKT